jgi:TrmH family RNA methyltransferase
MKQANNSNSSSTAPWANIRIVLVETSHPGNIGGVARAMKNMQLESLYLVSPASFPDADAFARASGAADVLDGAVVCSSLLEAISDCRLVIAATARSRTIEWPQLDAPEAARELTGMAGLGPVALVFGRESSGLNNEELNQCHKMVSLPANPDFSSLNLACAVQVLAYEIRLACLASSANSSSTPKLKRGDLPADSDKLDQMFKHMEDTLLKVEFMPPHRTTTLMRKLKRFFFRARTSEEEVAIFRGIISELDRLDGLVKKDSESG